MSMEMYLVFWTKAAQLDLTNILEYIAGETGQQADAIYQLIKQKAELLQTMPQQGRVVPELRFFGILSYRELICRPWRIIYKVEESKVFILAVIDGRRNAEDILLDRFMP